MRVSAALRRRLKESSARGGHTEVVGSDAAEVADRIGPVNFNAGRYGWQGWCAHRCSSSPVPVQDFLQSAG